MAEDFADLARADEVAEFVDAVLDAFDGVGETLDRGVECEADRSGLQLDHVGTRWQRQPVV